MQFQVFFQVRKATNYYFTYFNCLGFITDCPGYLFKSDKKIKPPTQQCDVSKTITKKPGMDNTLTSLSSEVHSCDVEDDSTDISIGSTCTNPKICEQNECAIPKAQDNTHSTINWGIALEKIILPQFWTYQQIGEELFTLFQTKVINDTIKIVKGITLKRNSVTFCVNGESCKPKDFQNLCHSTGIRRLHKEI